MKKEAGSNDCGIVGLVFGMLSVVSFSILSLPLGIIGLAFSICQSKKSANAWSKWGKILSIIGIAFGIFSVILSVILLFKKIDYLLSNPEALAQISGVGR